MAFTKTYGRATACSPMTPDQAGATVPCERCGQPLHVGQPMTISEYSRERGVCKPDDGCEQYIAGAMHVGCAVIVRRTFKTPFAA